MLDHQVSQLHVQFIKCNFTSFNPWKFRVQISAIEVPSTVHEWKKFRTFFRSFLIILTVHCPCRRIENLWPSGTVGYILRIGNAGHPQCMAPEHYKRNWTRKGHGRSDWGKTESIAGCVNPLCLNNRLLDMPFATNYWPLARSSVNKKKLHRHHFLETI